MINTDSSRLLMPPGFSLPQVLQSSLLSHHAVHSGAKTSRPVPEFLYHLTRMLKDSSNHHLIEWDSGRIIVHDPSRLESEVLGQYFRHSKYSSFQRQLNYFGFSKVSGKRKMSPCSYTNDQATEDLCSLVCLKRKTAKKSNKAAEDFKEEIEKAASKVTPLQSSFCLGPSTAESSQISSTTSTKLPPPMMFGNQPFIVRAEEYGAPGTQASPVAAIEPTPSVCSTAYETDSSTLSLQEMLGSGPMRQSHHNPIAPLPQNPLLLRQNFDQALSQQQQQEEEQQQQLQHQETNHMNDTATFLALESIFGGDFEDDCSSSDGSGSEESSWLPDPLGPTVGARQLCSSSSSHSL